MKIKAIIFDLDNTLVDRNSTLMKFADKFAYDYSALLKTLSKEDVIKQIRLSDRNGYRNKEELFMELLEILPWQIKPSITQLMEYWKIEFTNCSVPMNGLENVLMALKEKGLKLGLITNGSVATQSKKMKKLNIEHYFDSIIISEAVKIKKPDSQIFQLSLVELNVSAKEAIFVGDNPLIDIVGASNAGLNAIWLKGEEDWNIEYSLPSKIANNLEELIDLVS